MSNFDSDGGSENQWEDRGDLAWNEFDWERYLREQDEAVQRYLRFYAECKGQSDRIDQVAEKMQWGDGDWADDSDGETDVEVESDDEAVGSEEDEVYTLHKNPIFIATKAIYVSLNQSWQLFAVDPGFVPQATALSLLASLHRGEEHAVQAIHALDFGDYAMAVSLFKRALSALNGTLALLGDEALPKTKILQAWRQDAIPSLFDLREIWLRVMSECREELERPMDDDN